jgi:hypothetical protein
VVARIFIDPRLVNTGTIAKAATTTPTVIQVRPLREGGCPFDEPFELWAVGNRLSFKVWREQAQALIYTAKTQSEPLLPFQTVGILDALSNDRMPKIANTNPAR